MPRLPTLGDARELVPMEMLRLPWRCHGHVDRKRHGLCAMEMPRGWFREDATGLPRGVLMFEAT